MKLTDIIYSVCDLINLPNIRSVLQTRQSAMVAGVEFSFTTTMANEIIKIVNHINLALERIAREYVVFVKTETLTTNADGKIEYSAFAESPHEIINCKSEGVSNGQKYYIEPSCVVFSQPNKSYTLTYRYIPQKYNYTEIDETVPLPCYVPVMAVVYAVASDWCIASNCFDESSFWNSQYKKSLRESLRSSKERKFAKRKFL